MTREQIEAIAVGQTGVYEFDRALPVSDVGPVRTIVQGPDAGKLFRYVRVQRGTTKIGFIVAEGDK